MHSSAKEYVLLKAFGGGGGGGGAAMLMKVPRENVYMHARAYRPPKARRERACNYVTHQNSNRVYI